MGMFEIFVLVGLVWAIALLHQIWKRLVYINGWVRVIRTGEDMPNPPPL